MIIKKIPFNELKFADKFQQNILNTENNKRYRTFSYIKKQYKRYPELFIGAYHNKKLVGIIFGYVKRRNVLLGEMAIDQKVRGKGVGSKLLIYFEKLVKMMNMNKIILGAREDVEKFYLKKGYKPILFLQIKHNKVPKNYLDLLSKYKVIKETNRIDAKRLSIEVKKPSKQLNQKLVKLLNAFNGIYLFEKRFN